MITAADILNFLLSGSVESATFALIALGFSLVYGVGGIFNLAHGSYFIIAGFVGFWILSNLFYFGLSIVVIISVIIIVTIIGGLMYLALIKPMQETPTGVILITFAFAYLVQEYLKVVFIGQETVLLDELELIPITIETGIRGFSINLNYILIIGVSIITIVSFYVFLNKSKLGNSIRAVSQDKEAAQLMGINSNRILLYTVMIAASFAALAAMFYIPVNPIKATDGFRIINQAFAIVILGGMGSIAGTIIGACILGFSIQFIIKFGSELIIPIESSWANFIPMILIVIMITIRPQGIFGKKEI